MSVGDKGDSLDSASLNGLAGSIESSRFPIPVGAESSDTLEELADLIFSPADGTVARGTLNQHDNDLLGKQFQTVTRTFGIHVILRWLYSQGL